jgi:hypothetical protein
LGPSRGHRTRPNPAVIEDQGRLGDKRRISLPAEQGKDARQRRDQGEGEHADHGGEGASENQTSEHSQHCPTP